MTCLESVQKKIDFKPEVALILGSGLGDFADGIKMERVFRGIKMETKQQFLEEINKVKGSKRDYLNKLFQYVS